MNYATIKKTDVANGPGVRAVSYTHLPGTPGYYKTDYTIDHPGRVSILIPTCDHIPVSYTHLVVGLDMDVFHAIQNKYLDDFKAAMDTDDKNVRDAALLPIMDKIAEEYPDQMCIRDRTKTWPSSCTSILQLQVAQMSWMTLPPLPMTLSLIHI